MRKKHSADCTLLVFVISNTFLNQLLPKIQQNKILVMCQTKICIKYRKHWSSSFSHTFNCVWQWYRGPIFRMPKVLSDGSTWFKDTFQFLFWFYIRKYLKSLKETSHRLRKYVFRFKSMSFCNHWLEPTCFFGFKRGDPNFF